MAKAEPVTAIVVTKDKPRGRVAGVSVPATPEQIAANRVQAWKHGRYAKSVTLIEARARKLSEKDPDLVYLTEGFREALEGSLDGSNSVAALSLAETESRRRKVSDQINEDGVVLEEVLFDKNGEIVGSRKRAHPLLEVERALARDLGHTAADMQLTKKSRGEGAKDEALAAMLRRDAQLRGWSKEGMAPPPALPPGGDEGESK